ncbi:MAG TPA: hypothetical protein VEF04_02255 [Blastocatellia bacterium]|nr:hypothetical protein [Blastocatellia bacterium]
MQSPQIPIDGFLANNPALPDEPVPMPEKPNPQTPDVPIPEPDGPHREPFEPLRPTPPFDPSQPDPAVPSPLTVPPNHDPELI